MANGMGGNKKEAKFYADLAMWKGLQSKDEIKMPEPQNEIVLEAETSEYATGRLRQICMEGGFVLPSYAEGDDWTGGRKKSFESTCRDLQQRIRFQVSPTSLPSESVTRSRSIEWAGRVRRSRDAWYRSCSTEKPSARSGT